MIEAVSRVHHFSAKHCSAVRKFTALIQKEGNHKPSSINYIPVELFSALIAPLPLDGNTVWYGKPIEKEVDNGNVIVFVNSLLTFAMMH